MKRSTERILTTHTGSLPRPKELVPLVVAKDRGQPYDEADLEAHIRGAVGELVRKQVEVGIDIVNDGEVSKPSYVTYAKDRLAGFGGKAAIAPARDIAEFPDFVSPLTPPQGSGPVMRAACDGPISYKGLDACQRDIENFLAALNGVDVSDRFLTAAAPGVISVFLPNTYYASHEEYIWALAKAMKEEYNAIAEAGIPLQVDCPDLALSRHVKFGDLNLEQFRDTIKMHIEALNYALEDIDPENLRMHLCWGNYEGPHNHDVPFRDIVDIVLGARPRFISFEAANPRHEHEWKLWETVKLPDEKVLIPGVLDSTTNFIEHPELVQERIERFARLVGRERVIAGTDCGFSTGVGNLPIVPSITWAKFQSMAEGARLASESLW